MRNLDRALAFAFTAALAACTVNEAPGDPAATGGDQPGDPTGVRVLRVAGDGDPDRTELAELDVHGVIAFDDESIDPEGGHCHAQIVTCHDEDDYAVCQFLQSSHCTPEEGFRACMALFRSICGINP